MDSTSEQYRSRLERADEARKSGAWQKAAGHYADAIRQLEKSVAPEAEGLPPEPYRQCAKMLYHVGEDDGALELLDRYLERTEHPDDELGELRARLASEEMQRQPWRYDED